MAKKKRVNSCVKGKVGERALFAYLHKLGFHDARRTQQHNGAEGKSDVVCEETLPGLHIECKYGVKGMDLGTRLLDDACDQAAEDAGDTPWVVLWKPYRKSQWLMTYYDDCSLVTIHHDGAIQRRLFGLVNEVIQP